MGNNQNQIIKQALEIVSENNRIALKSITNNSAIKTNFYKLSDLDIRPDLREELEKEHEPSDPSLDWDDVFLPKRKDDDSDPDPEPEPEPERIDPNEYKRPSLTGLFAKLEKWSLDGQARAIFESDFEYAAKKRGLSKPEMKEMDQDQKDDFMRSLGLKTLKEIHEMDPEKRAKHLGVDYNDRLRMPSSRILNLNVGNNR